MSTALTAYKYKARTLTGGEVKEGIIQGANPEDARRQLVRSRLIPEWIKEAPKPEAKAGSGRFKAKMKAVTLFARQFSTLIGAGIPIVQAIDMSAELAEDKGLRKTLEQISIDVQSGRTLAESMRPHTRVFPNIFINMVGAGEQGGVLDSVLERVALYLEKSQAIQEKIRGAMIYPVIILVVAIGSASVMLAFVVPTFAEMFAGSGLALPYPTQLLINMSDFIIAYKIQLAAGVAGSVFFVRTAYRTKGGREFFDNLMLRTPIMGDLILKSGIARFTQSMASLLTAGVNLIDALVASAATAGNVIIEKALTKARSAIESGQGISGPLEDTGILPSLVPKMVRVGEQTGALDEMFYKVAIYYERQVETAADRLTKAMEPVMLVVVGVIMGAMVVALYLPIFEALTSLGD